KYFSASGVPLRAARLRGRPRGTTRLRLPPAPRAARRLGPPNNSKRKLLSSAISFASRALVDRISLRSESSALLAAARAWRTIESAPPIIPLRFRRLGISSSSNLRRSLAHNVGHLQSNKSQSVHMPKHLTTPLGQ